MDLATAFLAGLLGGLVAYTVAAVATGGVRLFRSRRETERRRSIIRSTATRLRAFVSGRRGSIPKTEMIVARFGTEDHHDELAPTESLGVGSDHHDELAPTESLGVGSDHHDELAPTESLGVGSDHHDELAPTESLGVGSDHHDELAPTESLGVGSDHHDELAPTESLGVGSDHHDELAPTESLGVGSDHHDELAPTESLGVGSDHHDELAPTESLSYELDLRDQPALQASRTEGAGRSARSERATLAPTNTQAGRGTGTFRGEPRPESVTIGRDADSPDLILQSGERLLLQRVEDAYVLVRIKGHARGRLGKVDIQSDALPVSVDARNVVLFQDDETFEELILPERFLPARSPEGYLRVEGAAGAGGQQWHTIAGRGSFIAMRSMSEHPRSIESIDGKVRPLLELLSPGLPVTYVAEAVFERHGKYFEHFELVVGCSGPVLDRSRMAIFLAASRRMLPISSRTDELTRTTRAGHTDLWSLPFADMSVLGRDKHETLVVKALR